MPITSPVFRTLEAELQRRLVFSYSVERLFDGTGASATYLKVTVRNDSSVKLSNLRGTISPASGAEFKKVWFRIRTLEPLQETEISRIEARVPGTYATVPMAKVDVSSEADLSFRFCETGHGLTYVAPTSALTSNPQTRPRKRSMRRTRTPRVEIPLSPMHDAH